MARTKYNSLTSLFRKKHQGATGYTLPPVPSGKGHKMMKKARKPRKKASIYTLRTRRYKKLKRTQGAVSGDRAIYRRLNSDYEDLNRHKDQIYGFKDLYREGYKAGNITVGKRARRRNRRR